MANLQQIRPRFPVGDWVSFDYGARRAFAQIIEDRGLLGADRRRLYRLRLKQGQSDQPPLEFEMPEDELTGVASKPALLSYLKDGGLVALLNANRGGGKQQPRAWLTIADDGRIGHTFEASRGTIGGATIPFYAIEGGRIFLPKVDEVIGFLASFGLGFREAEEIIRSVGTFP